MNKLQPLVSTAHKAKTFFIQSSLFIKIIIIAIVLGAVWFGYKTFFSNSEATIQYQTAEVEKGTLIVTVTASGQVSSTNNAAISTQSTGVV